MKIETNLVPRASIINNNGFKIKVGATRQTIDDIIGSYYNKSGVYVLNRNSDIIYVGHTTDNFSAGIYTHITGSKDRDIYKDLSKDEHKNKDLFVFLLCVDDVDMLLDSNNMQLTKQQKVCIYAKTLISIYNPILNKDNSKE